MLYFYKICICSYDSFWDTMQSVVASVKSIDWKHAALTATRKAAAPLEAAEQAE